MRPNNVSLISQTNTGTIYSSAIDANFIVSGSVQASFSDGTAAGTLTIEGSDDPPKGLAVDANGNPTPTNWVTVKNGSNTASASVASGATTNISMQWFNHRWLRVKWVQSGGAGTITVVGQFQSV